MDSKSGSKRNRPNYDKAIQGQKIKFLRKRKYKIRDSNTFIQPYFPVSPQIMTLKWVLPFIKASSDGLTPFVVNPHWEK